MMSSVVHGRCVAEPVDEYELRMQGDRARFQINDDIPIYLDRGAAREVFDWLAEQFGLTHASVTTPGVGPSARAQIDEAYRKGQQLGHSAGFVQGQDDIRSRLRKVLGLEDESDE